MHPYLERTHKGYHWPDPESKRGLNQHSLLHYKGSQAQLASWSVGKHSKTLQKYYALHAECP